MYIYISFTHKTHRISYIYIIYIYTLSNPNLLSMDMNGIATHVSPGQKPGVGQYTIYIYTYTPVHLTLIHEISWYQSNYMILHLYTHIYSLSFSTWHGNHWTQWWGPRVVEPEVCHSHWWPRQLEREAKPQQCNGRPHQGPRWQWRSQHKCHVAQREPAIHLLENVTELLAILLLEAMILSFCYTVDQWFSLESIIWSRPVW